MVFIAFFKMREARRLEQENNPHYLKQDSSKKLVDSNSVVNNVASIPNIIPGNAEINVFYCLRFQVQLRIAKVIIFGLGLASSDKYLTQKSRKNKVKLKTKKKKRRKTISEEEENDEEEQIDVIVNRGRGEMPEGAEDSGGETDERRDVDDPHAALDIDLEGFVHFTLSCACFLPLQFDFLLFLQAFERYWSVIVFQKRKV